jgi:urea transport system permease protein
MEVALRPFGKIEALSSMMREHTSRPLFSAPWRFNRFTPILGFVLLLLNFHVAVSVAHAESAGAAAAQPADAAELQSLIRDLALASEDDQEKALEKLIEADDFRLALALEAFRTGQLYRYGDAVVYVPQIVQEAGSKKYPLMDALTAAPLMAGDKPMVVDESQVKAIEAPGRKLRKLIVAGKVSLELSAPNAEARVAAVRKAGDARDAVALDKLKKLAVDDMEEKVRYAAMESALLIEFSQNEPASKAALDAVTRLGEMKSRRALTTLRETRETLSKGANVEPAAMTVYNTAIARLEGHETKIAWMGHIFRGLSAGSILVLMALGLAITFGLMGVINMAHGEMMMIGAVTTWAVHELFVASVPPEYFNWYFVAALPLAFLASAAAGLIIELFVVRFLYKRPLESLLATLGVSSVLIQAVRLWKGDNLGMSSPSFLTGGIEIVQDVVLPYNRLFIIGLTAVCVAGIAAMLRFTPLGLMIRATSQNREVAQSLGVSTRLVDACTFAFGAGLAGIAGYAITLISNVTPEMGTSYTVDSFLVVVTGGVGKLLGVISSGMGLGMLLKLVEPLNLGFLAFDATWAKVAVLAIVVAFIQYRPSGLFPDKGRLADMGDASSRTAFGIGLGSRRVEWALGITLIVGGLLLIPLAHITGLMSIEMVNKLGQFMAFAIVAIGLDLIWGFMGTLSLCQFLFFALGGYSMGMYLAHHGPLDGVNQIPRALYVVSSSVGDITLPWFWVPFKWLPAAVVLGLLVPGLVALGVGLIGFASRVRGVYFAILTQAVTIAFWLIFQKNDIRLCGTNGLTNFVQIAGFNLAAGPDAAWYEQTRFWLYIVSVLCLIGVFALAKYLVHSPFGRVLIAIRDDENRLRFAGYRTWVYKTAAFTLAGLFAGLGGILYSPQKGIITPEQMTAFSSIMVVVWVAVGGRGSLWGAILGALFVNLLYDLLTSRVPDAWPFVLGGLFIGVVLILPGGLMSLPGQLRAFAARIKGPVATPAPAAATSTATTTSTAKSTPTSSVS